MGRSHELGGRSVNSRFVLGLFFRNVEKRDGFCNCTVSLGRNFFAVFFLFSAVITGWSLFQRLLFYCFVMGLKMHYLLPICKERFSFHTALSLYFHTWYFLLSILSFDLLFSHTKNHSSSFSAKKKRKKSVITFNFNSDSITQRTNDDDCSLLIKIATDGEILSPHSLSRSCSAKVCSTQQTFSTEESQKSRTNSRSNSKTH